MRASHYAQALATFDNAPLAERENAVRRLVQVAEKNGHAHLLPKIIRVYTHLTEKAKRQSIATVTTAKEITHEKARSFAKAEGIDIDTHTLAQTVDPTLIGGFVLRTRGERIDRSDKRALLEIYKKVIS